jgi:hypothetical protein
MKNLKSEILCRIPLNIFILKFACKTAVRKWSDIYFVVFFCRQLHVLCSVVDLHWFQCGSGSRDKPMMIHADTDPDQDPGQTFKSQKLKNFTLK